MPKANLGKISDMIEQVFLLNKKGEKENA